MLTRKITNKQTYKEKMDGESYLSTTEYTRKVYLWGIKIIDHSFIDDNFSLIKDVTPSKSMGFAKPNKNT